MKNHVLTTIFLAFSLILSVEKVEAVAQSITDSTYEIHISIADQRVTVLKNNKPIRKMICSTGKPETPTKTGEFKTISKKDYVWYESHKVGVYYSIRMEGQQGIHSTVFDRAGDAIKETYKNLGKPVTGGCIRVELMDARWIYNHVPTGSKVIIQ